MFKGKAVSTGNEGVTKSATAQISIQPGVRLVAAVAPTDTFAGIRVT